MTTVTIDMTSGNITRSESSEKFPASIPPTVSKSSISGTVITCQSIQGYDHAVREAMKLWPNPVKAADDDGFNPMYGF